MAADTTTLVPIVEGALTFPGVSFFDGYVPAKVPESGGFILPYIVLWAGDGQPADQATADGLQGTSLLRWDFQTSVVAATPDLCRRVARDVRTRLTNLRAGTGRIKPNPDGFQQQQPIHDTAVTPNRFYLPLPWRLHTN